MPSLGLLNSTLLFPPVSIRQTANLGELPCGFENGTECDWDGVRTDSSDVFGVELLEARPKKDCGFAGGMTVDCTRTSGSSGDGDRLRNWDDVSGGCVPKKDCGFAAGMITRTPDGSGVGDRLRS
jgi:hypothetical protein